MADERIEAAQQFATITPSDEQAGWDWLTRMVEAVSDEAPEDITYSADQMVDAFMAGRQTRPAPKADSALVGELREKAAMLLANAVPDADDDDRDLVEYSRALNAILAALSDRDVVLERLLRDASATLYRLEYADAPNLGISRRLKARIDAALKGGVDG